MATHDYVIDNSTGANVRADINSVLQAILTNNSSSSAPSTTAAYMFWADTTSGTLKIRNSSDNAWVELLQLDGTLTLEAGSASTPALAFRSDLNTGIYQDTSDEFNIATGGTERLSMGGSNTIFNETGADVDFRIESDTQTHMFFLDAGNNRIGINKSNPSHTVHIVPLATSTDGTDSVTNSTVAINALYIRNKGNSAGLSGQTYSNQIISSNGSNVALEIYTQGSGTGCPIVFGINATERARIDTGGRLLIGKTTGSFMLDIGAGSSSLVRLTNTLESSHGSHDTNIVAGGTYYQNLTLQQRSFKVQTFNDSSVVNGFTLTPNQKALFGTYFSETTSGGATCQLQVQGTDHNTSGILAARFAADDGGPRLSFLKSRSSSGGGVDKLLENDTCGSIFWVAANNNDVNNGFMACISVEADATQGGADTPGRMRFFTTPDGSSTLQERMRIDKDGNVLIGTTDTNLMTSGGDGDKGMVISKASGFQVKATSHHTAEFNRAGTTGGNVLFFQNGTEVGNIAVTASATSYNTSSDYRLKENVVAISDGITRLKTLKPSRFNFKADASTTLDGFLAHEVTAVPEAVTGTKDEVVTQSLINAGEYKQEALNNPIYQGIDQSKLVPLLVAAVQELITKVETLEAA